MSETPPPTGPSCKTLEGLPLEQQKRLLDAIEELLQWANRVLNAVDPQSGDANDLIVRTRCILEQCRLTKIDATTGDTVITLWGIQKKHDALKSKGGWERIGWDNIFKSKDQADEVLKTYKPKSSFRVVKTVVNINQVPYAFFTRIARLGW